jgi:myosin heavy subunit
MRINILDIFGFESFKNNSFEQFCINYANEKLQAQFYNYLFIKEQEEYKRESVPIPEENMYPNNDACLKLIEGQIGIIDLLNEETKFPKGTGDTFLNKLHSKWGAMVEKKGNTFSVKHYAEKVTYDTSLFLQKNSNSLVILLNSENNLIKQFSSMRKEYLIHQFKQDLSELVEKINKTSPHYIRCIKPNDEKKPNKFINDRVLSQLRYGGIVEAIKVAQAGYPTRILIDQFIERYSILGELDTLLKRKGIYKGDTKIFMKAELLGLLENERTVRISKAATTIQRIVRGFLCRKSYQKTIKSIILQKYIRSFNQIKKYRDHVTFNLRKVTIDSEELFNLRNEIFKLTEDNGKLTNELNLTKTENNELIQNNGKLTQELNKVAQDNRKLTNELSLTKTENSELTQNNSELTQKLNLTKTENSELTNELSAIKTENSELTQDKDKLIHSTKNLEIKLNKISTEFLSQVHIKVKDHDEVIAKLNNVITTLKDQAEINKNNLKLN